MKRRYRRLLKMLYDDLGSNCRRVDSYYEKYKLAKSIGATKTAEYFYELMSLHSEEGKRILTTIDEIEKRVS